ncbi:MAG: hypothetical protein K9G62_07610 [Alphaproteobacteria bacterium]|nr:hypothetical protein [Alphaproteobacteria bacterium]
MRKLTTIFMAAALTVAAGFQKLSGQNILPHPDSTGGKPKTEIKALLRFITDIDLDKKGNRYNYDLQNVIVTAAMPGGWNVQSAVKLDNLNPEKIGDKEDLRLFYLNGSKKTGPWNIQGGLLPPFFMGNLPRQVEQTFPLPALDRGQTVRGGVTGALVRRTCSWGRRTELGGTLGIGWKIPFINARFGDEAGPGTSARPSFFGQASLTRKVGKNGKAEAQYHGARFAKGLNGKSQSDNYAAALYSDQYGKISVLFMAEAIKSNGKLKTSLLGQGVFPVGKHLRLRGAAGLLDGKPGADGQVIGTYGRYKIAAGAGYDFSAHKVRVSLGLSASL